MSAQNTGGILFADKTATAAGARIRLCGPQHTFMASGETSAGAGAATIVVQVTNKAAADDDAVSGDDHGYWITAGTITLTLGTTVTADGFTINAPWKYARFWISAISGTNATVQCFYGTWTGQ